MAKKLDMNSPFPNSNVLPLEADGRWSRVWLEFLLKQYERTGGAPGIDTRELKAKIDAIEMLVNADPAAAIIATLLQRVAELEALVISMPVPVPARAPAVVLPDPVAVVARSASLLPDPVPVAPRAPDDVRKLIEA
ncbi:MULTISPECIES: hypothetical protein [Burkholderia]|nr:MULTISPECIES: hypothetical protein [Burkholderia]MBY4725187.1 hypothetical protein [Burkholderia contaminans]MCI3970799.1 hypothetical protein [Burkholderia sp. HI4860]OXJ04449.1 hypothetical protein CFB48_06775 [Burkholderia sp. AU33647]